MEMIYNPISLAQINNRKIEEIRTLKLCLNLLRVVSGSGEVCLSSILDGGEQGEGRQGGAPRHAQGQAQSKSQYPEYPIFQKVWSILWSMVIDIIKCI